MRTDTPNYRLGKCGLFLCRNYPVTRLSTPLEPNYYVVFAQRWSLYRSGLQKVIIIIKSLVLICINFWPFLFSILCFCFHCFQLPKIIIAKVVDTWSHTLFIDTTIIRLKKFVKESRHPQNCSHGLYSKAQESSTRWPGGFLLPQFLHPQNSSE